MIMAPVAIEGKSCAFSLLNVLKAEEFKPKIPTVIATLEKLSAKLSYSSRLSKDAVARTRALVERVVLRSTVPVTAYLGGSKLSVRELLSIQEGDILQLDNLVSGYVAVNVGDKKKFYAKPGRVGDKSAVQIVSRIQ